MEIELSPFERNLSHWLHRTLLFWQRPLQPVTNISSKYFDNILFHCRNGQYRIHRYHTPSSGSQGITQNNDLVLFVIIFSFPINTHDIMLTSWSSTECWRPSWWQPSMHPVANNNHCDDLSVSLLVVLMELFIEWVSISPPRIMPDRFCQPNYGTMAVILPQGRIEAGRHA